MAWAKIDDQFADHPKVIAAGPLASWLYVCGLTYCARLLTDGFIPTGQVRKLADLDRALDLAQILVGVGLWTEVAGGYLVHDYLEYNPSRERVLATREVRAQAGSRGGKQKASNLLDVSLPVATDNVVAKSYPVPQPVPRPHPGQIPDPGGETARAEARDAGADAPPAPAMARKSRSKREETRIPDDFPLTDDMRRWAAERFPDLDVEAAHLEFCTFWRGDGRRKADWGSTWQNGMIKADERRRERPMPRASPTRSNGRLNGDDAATEAIRLLRGQGRDDPADLAIEATYSVRRT